MNTRRLNSDLPFKRDGFWPDGNPNVVKKKFRERTTSYTFNARNNLAGGKLAVLFDTFETFAHNLKPFPLIGSLPLEDFGCRAAAITVHWTPQSPDRTSEKATDFLLLHSHRNCLYEVFGFFSGTGRKTSFARIKMALIYVLTVATMCASVSVVYLHRWVDLIRKKKNADRALSPNFKMGKT